MRKYKLHKLLQKSVCLMLTAALIVTSGEMNLDTKAVAEEIPDNEAVVSNLVGNIALDDMKELPTGDICELLTFSDEEVAACEVTEDEMDALVSTEQIAESENELAADLQAYYEEKLMEDPDMLIKSENAVSDNSAEELDVEELGYATIEDAADYIRAQMVKRKTLVTVKLAKGPDSAQRNIQKILKVSTDYYPGCAPAEGDYIYWNFKSYAWKQTGSNSQTVTYRIVIDWRSGASEEAWVNTKLAEVIGTLDLRNPQKSEYEKVSQIYDYIMDTITYDTFNFTYNQTTYMPMYTVYHALSAGKGVCQAYALLFYRLCREVGIESRLIYGNDNEQGIATHGWNIVKIGEYFYNVDATWDDEMSDRRTYFLKNKDDFWGHTRNISCDTSDYAKQFPMAAKSYDAPVSMVTAANLNVVMDSLTGEKVSTAAAAGKCKILYFFHANENGSSNALENIKQLSALNSPGCDVVIYDLMPGTIYTQLFIKMNMSETDFANRILEKLGNPFNVSYVKQSDLTRSLRNQYAALVGAREVNGCLGVLIDANNQVRYVSGISGINKMEEAYRLVAGNCVIQSMGAAAATQISNNKVQLSWNAYPGASRYYIYRRNGAGSYACVGTSDGSSYVNEIPSAGDYSYMIYASNGTEFIGATDETTVTCGVRYLSKGKTVTVDGCKYKVLSSGASKKTVAFAGVTGASVTKVIIPATVKIDGMTYKVTEVTKNALKNKNKVKTVSIGKNVQKIGAGAFMGCKKLVQIVIEGKSLKSVGKNAFKNTAKKAVVFVPGAKLNAYKKLLAKKGLSAKASIKK